MMKKIALMTACGSLAISAAFASTVTVNLDEEHQVIRGFGGMVHNEWQGGAGLSDADAELAFGTGDGHIGLNTLRIPVYANSGSFNKEVNAAKAAKKYAGDDFLFYATPWTSPYAGANQHIKSSDYQKYVDHLNSFTKYMKDQGIPLDAISISNEPDWCGEWACWSADEIYNFTKGYADQMRKNGTKVISTESFRYDKNLYNKVLNDASALKNWDILGAHFYASEAKTGDDFFAYSLADQKGVERWMTEHYTESQGSGNYWRTVMRTGDQANQSKMDTVRAMDVAYEIHRAMVVGNFNQYTWWYIRRCYGLIMEKDFGNKLQVPQNEIGKISKRGYVMSQFARFVRPGAIRVGATAKPEANLFASAYKSADGDSTIVVLVNRDYKNAKTVTINVKGANIETFHVYTTSEAKNAKYDGEVEVKDGSVTITTDAGNTSNKDCIVTLVGVGPQIIVPREPFGGKKAVLPGKIEVEDFDIPGSGKGNNTYKDNESENKGASKYRDGLGVDLYDEGTGVVLGMTQTGEWLEYSVNVTADGEYDAVASVSSGTETSSFRMLLDGEEIVPTTTVPKTGEDWSVYKELSLGKVKFTKGEHIIRLEIMSDYVNIDWMQFCAGDKCEESETTENGNVADSSKNVPADTTMAIAAMKFNASNVMEIYVVYDLMGSFMGRVEAMNGAEAVQKARGLVRNGGAYLVKSMTGNKMFRFTAIK
ncbi:MAG: carbohydrate-binding protein [Fibrobacter sp.]|nr:carbohydrate-binding protein [Fibrobacter sp.]